jgi:hypothetical protein
VNKKNKKNKKPEQKPNIILYIYGEKTGAKQGRKNTILCLKNDIRK